MSGPNRAAAVRPVVPVRIDPRAQAAAARDDLDCERQVMALAGRDARGAFALLQGCVGAHKFRNLRLLFTTPWKEQLFALGEGGAYDLVAHVVANRGASGADMAGAREGGVLLYEVAAVIKAPARFRGRYVLFRGRVVEQRGDAAGRLFLEISETERKSEDRQGYYDEYEQRRRSTTRSDLPGSSEVERSWQSRRYGKVGSSEFSIETGRAVLAEAGPTLEVVQNDREYVFLARFSEVRAKRRGPDDPDDLPPETETEVQLVRWYPLGVVLPELSR